MKKFQVEQDLKSARDLLLLSSLLWGSHRHFMKVLITYWGASLPTRNISLIQLDGYIAGPQSMLTPLTPTVK